MGSGSVKTTTNATTMQLRQRLRPRRTAAMTMVEPRAIAAVARLRQCGDGDDVAANSARPRQDGSDGDDAAI